MNPSLLHLQELITLESEAVERGDWNAFMAAQVAAQEVIVSMGSLEPTSQVPLEMLLSEVEALRHKLSTRHDITGRLMTYLRDGKRSGKVLDLTY